MTALFVTPTESGAELHFERMEGVIRNPDGRSIRGPIDYLVRCGAIAISRTVNANALRVEQSDPLWQDVNRAAPE